MRNLCLGGGVGWCNCTISGAPLWVRPDWPYEGNYSTYLGFWIAYCYQRGEFFMNHILDQFSCIFESHWISLILVRTLFGKWHCTSKGWIASYRFQSRKDAKVLLDDLSWSRAERIKDCLFLSGQPTNFSMSNFAASHRRRYPISP